MLHGITGLFQRCYKSVTGVLQRCYKSVTGVLESSYRCDTRLYRGVTDVLQECFRVAVLQSMIGMLKGCYRVLQDW